MPLGCTLNKQKFRVDIYGTIREVWEHMKMKFKQTRNVWGSMYHRSSLTEIRVEPDFFQKSANNNDSFFSNLTYNMITMSDVKILQQFNSLPIAVTYLPSGLEQSYLFLLVY